MTTLFVVCAALGGTVLVLQFIMALIGLGGESLGIDMPHDVGHDMGGLDHDLGGGLDHDLGGDAGGDLHGETSADAHGTEHAAAAHHSANWFFGVLSFRTIVAALAFFGIAGLAAESSEASTPTTLAVAVLAGLAAMYGVYALMQGIRSLKAEGTARIERAVGQEASVYLRIPGNRSGIGKIHLNLQNRTMEYMALTEGEAIPTGAKVVVTGIVGSDTVQVQLLMAAERNDNV